MDNFCLNWNSNDVVAVQRFSDPGTIAKVLETASKSIFWKIAVPTGLGIFVVRQIPTCFPNVASRCSQWMASATSWISGLRNRFGRSQEVAVVEDELEQLIP